MLPVYNDVTHILSIAKLWHPHNSVSHGDRESGEDRTSQEVRTTVRRRAARRNKIILVVIAAVIAAIGWLFIHAIVGDLVIWLWRSNPPP
jgi:hypothetical protein